MQVFRSKNITAPTKSQEVSNEEMKGRCPSNGPPLTPAASGACLVVASNLAEHLARATPSRHVNATRCPLYREHEYYIPLSTAISRMHRELPNCLLSLPVPKAFIHYSQTKTSVWP